MQEKLENILTVFHQALEDWLDRWLDLLNKLLFPYKLHNFLSDIFVQRTYNCILYSTVNFCPNILHSDVICNFHHNKNQYLQIPKDLENNKNTVKFFIDNKNSFKLQTGNIFGHFFG